MTTVETSEETDSERNRLLSISWVATLYKTALICQLLIQSSCTKSRLCSTPIKCSCVTTGDPDS